MEEPFDVEGLEFRCVQFSLTWGEVAMETLQIAKDHGWEEPNQNDGESICLMHSELSEALEAVRHGNPPSVHIPQFSGVEEELADVVIRIMNYAARKGYRLPEAILAKKEFNRNRSFRHGGKAF
jgi:NTP pyrophosphatase (non-canonical NTP hydrolase)